MPLRYTPVPIFYPCLQASGDSLGAAIQVGVTMVSSVVLAFVFGPKLAAVALFFFPLVLAAGFIQGKLAQQEINTQRDEHLRAYQVSTGT